MLKRSLKYYAWILKDKRVIVVDKRESKNTHLQKVHYKSLAKFLIDALDRARIEITKELKEKIKRLRGENKELKTEIRRLKKELREVKR